MMSLDRTQKAALNFISSFGLTLVTFLTAMISSRLVIGYIGDERFGAFRSLFELFGYLNLMDAGLAASLRPLLAKALAKQELQQIPHLLQFGNRMYRLASWVHLMTGLVFCFFSAWLVPVSTELHPDLVIASIIFTGGMFNLYFCTTRCLCETIQRSFLVNLLLMGQSVCVTFSSMLLTRFFPQWGISILAFSLVFWVFIFNLILWFIMNPVRQQWQVNEQSATQPAYSVRDWLLHGRDTFLLMLSGRASLHSNNLFLGIIVGQVDVTRLYATQRLFEVAQTQLFAVGNASWAALAEMYHQNHHERFKSRVVQLLRLILVMGLSVVIPISCFNQEFITLWLGPSRFGGQTASVILAFLSVGLGITVFSTWCLMGTGQLKSILRLTFVTSVLDVVATIVFTKRFGLIGPVLGTSVMIYTVALPWHFKLLNSHFGITTRDLLKSCIPPIISIPFYVIFVAQIKNIVVPDSWIKLACSLALPSVTYIVIMGLILFRTDDWNLILQRFKPAFRKKQDRSQ